MRRKIEKLTFIKIIPFRYGLRLFLKDCVFKNVTIEFPTSGEYNK